MLKRYKKMEEVAKAKHQRQVLQAPCPFLEWCTARLMNIGIVRRLRENYNFYYERMGEIQY